MNKITVILLLLKSNLLLSASGLKIDKKFLSELIFRRAFNPDAAIPKTEEDKRKEYALWLDKERLIRDNNLAILRLNEQGIQFDFWPEELKNHYRRNRTYRPVWNADFTQIIAMVLE